MALKRMDNVGIVVDDLAATIDFFRELGLELEGRATIEGEWAGRVTGLGDQRVEIAMMRTPDGHGRLELSRFLAPPTVADHRDAPVNALGYLRVMFAVDDIDETLERLRKRGAQLVGEVVQYKDARIVSATSEGLKGFSLDSLKNSAERNCERLGDGIPANHQETEYLSITHSHVPSFWRRATSEVTVPSRLRVEVRARSPQMSAGRWSPNSNFRFSDPNPVTWS